MSYILDALRKADAERERDPSRGIHAQPVVQPEHAARQAPWWLAGAAVLLVGGAAIVGWLLRPAPVAPVSVRFAEAPVAPAVPTAPVTPSAAPALAPVPALVATPSPPARAIVPVAEAVSPPAPALLAPVPQRAPAKPAAVAKAAAPAEVPAPAAPTAARPAVAAPMADRVLAVAELPPDVQRELPKLQITGGVHSENAAQRMLIVGGQVMNEGAEIAPGVVLEQIRARGAVLKFRGYRYSVAY